MVRSYQDYTVGWICALEVEYVAACEMLDEHHDSLPSKSSRDGNAYTLGHIKNHNIVVACLPQGQHSIASAATVAGDMLCTFEAVHIGLMVGIGGGAPSDVHDIRLGDVVVGTPSGRLGGVLAYDHGKMIQDKEFEITGHLNAPPTRLLTALMRLNVQHIRYGNQIAEEVSHMIERNPSLLQVYRRPEEDRLYETSYIHKTDQSCTTGCETSVPPLVPRSTRGPEEDETAVHFGTIASADKVIKDANIRNRLAAEYGVLCFESQAAGLMNNFPCLVIRGIANYSDTHKNDLWQGYAAAAAAAYAKQLLESIPAFALKGTRNASGELQNLGMFSPIHAIIYRHERPPRGRLAGSSTASQLCGRINEQLN